MLFSSPSHSMHTGCALICAAISMAFLSTANAQTPIPGFNARKDNQENRIEKGEASGELTKREAAKLKSDKQAIEDKRKEFKSDGVLTARERAELRRDQNALSKKIFKQKHDEQDTDHPKRGTKKAL